jgi:two-component system chemotaxis response regulator CheB
MKRIRVLVVDDSAVMRKMLTEAMSGSRRIEVVGAAIDPYIAVNKIKRFSPDVLTLDIEMPRMDGLTFLSKIMVANPIPVIMVSAVTERGAAQTIKALELGAVDFILKPKIHDGESWGEFSRELVEKVIAASQSKIKGRALSGKSTVVPLEVEEKYSADVIIPRKEPGIARVSSEVVVAIGASTGGTEVIAEILSDLPEDVPGIVIVQHMPEKFTEAFARRVDATSRLYVKEAEQGDRVYRGVALVAPGNRHMLLRRDGGGYHVEINDGPPVNRHRPSVDVLFRSIAQAAGGNAVGIQLTGMGSDGASGLLEMREAKAATIAQDEASSTVFGMPREAIIMGAAGMVKNVGEIIEYLKELRQGASLVIPQ